MDAGPLPASETTGCRRCGRAFPSGEITGRGILRPRAEAQGGPYVEFRCPSCGTAHRLVPHGLGRYAPPGEAPPPPPPEAERKVPWAHARPDRPSPPPRPPPPERPAAAPPPRPTPPPAVPTAPDDLPVTSAAEALDLLGASPHASHREIEDAYRAKALRVHPDKVAHLDAEFVALAERKFRRLKAARDLLLGPDGPAP